MQRTEARHVSKYDLPQQVMHNLRMFLQPKRDGLLYRHP